MANLNSVSLSGNLTSDPELRHLPSGTALCELGVAVNKSRKNDKNEYENHPSFFDVKVWGNFGELVARKFSKGNPIVIQGELEQERWTTDDGNRSKVVVVARQIDGPAMYTAGNGNGSSAPASEAAAAAATPETQPAEDDIPF